MKIEDIVGKEIAVHCKSRKDFDLFLDEASKRGYLLCYRISQMWLPYDAHTCYSIDRNGYIVGDAFEDCKIRGYKIIDSLEVIGNGIINSDNPNLSTEIQEVIFNNPATIVKWKDGTKTVVKCQEGDTYDKEIGLAMCIAKKACGNKSNFNKVFDKWNAESKYTDDSLKMHIQDIVGKKIAVRCKTEIAADIFLNKAIACGYEYFCCGGGKAKENNYWNQNESQTCYRICEDGHLSYYDVDFYLSCGYKVIDSPVII